MSKPRPDPSRDPDALEVERLLRELRQQDGGIAPPSRPQRPRSPRSRAVAARAQPKPKALWLPSTPGVWARAALGVLLGVALIQWPYGDACGPGLTLKVAAVGVLVVAGVWAAVGSWRRRMAAAHIVALLITAWGLGLLAHEVLPRTGYWPDPAAWRCPPGSGPFPAPPVSGPPGDGSVAWLEDTPSPPVRTACCRPPTRTPTDRPRAAGSVVRPRHRHRQRKGRRGRFHPRSGWPIFPVASRAALGQPVLGRT